MNPDEVKALAELPHSEARKIIREKVDPKWGDPVPEGESLYKVKVKRTITETTTQTGYVILSAESARKAQSLAEDHEDIKWEWDDVDEEEEWDIGEAVEV